MGLAELLKRRRAAAASARPAAPKRALAGGRPAAGHKAAKTEASSRPRGSGRVETAAKRRSAPPPSSPPPASSSDSEEEDEDADVAASDAEDVDPAEAYERLLVSLSTRADADEALLRRGLELEGAEVEENDEDEEDEEEDDEEDDDGSDEDEAESGDEDDDAEAPADEKGDVSDEESDEEGDDEDGSSGSEGDEENGRAEGGSTADAAAAAASGDNREPVLARDPSQPPIKVLDETEVEALAAARKKFLSAADDRACPALRAALEEAWPGVRLQAAPGTSLPVSLPDALEGYGVRDRLVARWREIRADEASAEAPRDAADGSDGDAPGASKVPDFATPQQRALLALLSTRADALLPVLPRASTDRTTDPAVDVALLHALNVCLTRQAAIARGNARVREHPDDDPPRDQGFVRPSVLILLPTRGVARRWVRRLVQLAVPRERVATVQGRDRFERDFGGGDAEDPELPEKARRQLAARPADYRALFGANSDDDFRLGIKIARGNLRLGADLFGADVVVASPLNLELAREIRDVTDALCSIELVLAGETDVMSMQNWEHVGAAVGAVCGMPSRPRDADVMRVWEGHLAGQARASCSVVMLGAWRTPAAAATIRARGGSSRGLLALAPRYRGVLRALTLAGARGTFDRVALPPKAEDEPEARFRRFFDDVWPRVRDAPRDGQLVVVPSYLDYVRVRNELRRQRASFLALTEYTAHQDNARARAYFARGERKVLLTTERAWFYSRHPLRGARDATWYSPPEDSRFFEEVCGAVQESPVGGPPAVSLLFTKHDALALERLAGTERAARMLEGKGEATFLFR